MTIKPKTADEIETMRQSGRILDQVLRVTFDYIAAGKSLIDIDKFIGHAITTRKATAAFLNYHGYPANSCLSVNDVIVHGIPDAYILRDGDVISVDVGVKFEGYNSDAAFTKIIGHASPEAQRLLEVTQESLKVGIAAAVEGNVIGDIGAAIEQYVKANGNYGIVRDLTGHGIGQDLQESPEIANFNNHNQIAIVDGNTLAIEPMITTGSWQVVTDDDGWTVRTRDRSLAAHFESTIVVRDNDAEVLVPFPLNSQITETK